MTFRSLTSDLEKTFIDGFSNMSNKELVADFRAKKQAQNNLVAILGKSIRELTPFNVYRKEFDSRGIDYLEVLHNPDFVPADSVPEINYAEYAKQFLNITLTEDQAVFLWSLTTDDLDIVYQGCKTGSRSVYIVNYIESLCDDKGIGFPEERHFNNSERNKFFDNILDPESDIYNASIHMEVLNKIVLKCFDKFVEFYDENRNEDI